MTGVQDIMKKHEKTIWVADKNSFHILSLEKDMAKVAGPLS